jgi:sigma-E factor negative regulatory protein RseB
MMMAMYKLIGWLVVGACGLVCASVPSAMAETPENLLQRMDDAFSTLSYDGVFSYYTGGDLASLRVVHKVVDGVQRERLVHLNGAPREILRHGEDVSCIVMPGDDLLALEKSIPAGPFARAFVRQFDRISDTYALDTFGEGRVAGRLAVRVAVSPRDLHRYGYRLWLDKQTSLLLRAELVDHDGAKLEIFMFNQVLLGDDVTAAALEPEDAQGSMVSHLTLRPADQQWQPPAEAKEPMPSAWAVSWLPPGFKMATADLRHKPDSNQHVSSFMYSDGLAAFSIYIEPMPKRGAASMVSQNGATVAVTHRVGAKDAYYLVTLVGEIPQATAYEVIKNVHQKNS